MRAGLVFPAISTIGFELFGRQLLQNEMPLVTTTAVALPHVAGVITRESTNQTFDCRPFTQICTGDDFEGGSHSFGGSSGFSESGQQWTQLLEFV